jgi:hypothetical protein
MSKTGGGSLTLKEEVLISATYFAESENLSVQSQGEGS